MTAACPAASQEHAHALKISDELPHLKEAGKVKLADVRAALGRLEADAKELERNAKEDGSSGDKGETPGRAPGADPFAAVMRQFSESAAAEVGRLRNLLGQVEGAYKELLVYLKVGPKPKESDDLFTLLSEFVEQVKAAIPKPKPAPRKMQDAYLKGDDDGGADGEVLDPMAAKMDGARPTRERPLTAKASLNEKSSRAAPTMQRPNSQRPGSAKPGSQRGSTKGDKSDAGSNPNSGTLQEKSKEAQAKDDALQKRLEARFQKAREKKGDRGSVVSGASGTSSKGPTPVASPR